MSTDNANRREAEPYSSLSADRDEYCTDCDGETPHHVEITVKEMQRGKPLSRQPYRIATCLKCGRRDKRSTQ